MNGKTENKIAYLYQGNASVIQKASSGGAFIDIERIFFEKYNNAVCYGASFDANLDVHHEAAYNFSDCEKFSSSKYCASDFSKTLPEVMEKLQSGMNVLYSGTPCQIDALKKYLIRNDVDIKRLLTIDILCHGVPDKIWWNSYREWIEKKMGSKLTFFSFRWKKAHWHGYSMHAEFANGAEKTNTHDLQVYMDLYFTHYIMRKSCYHCKYASSERKGDITLGDFWGVATVMPGVLKRKQIDKGVSLVLGNSIKGINFLEKLEKQTDALMILCENEGYIKFQTSLKSPVNEPENINYFIQEFQDNGFEYIVKKYAGYGMKGRIRFMVKKMANVLGIVSLLKR